MTERLRMNDEIKTAMVRLIGPDGQFAGIMRTTQARVDVAHLYLGQNQ